MSDTYGVHLTYLIVGGLLGSTIPITLLWHIPKQGQKPIKIERDGQNSGSDNDIQKPSVEHPDNSVVKSCYTTVVSNNAVVKLVSYKTASAKQESKINYTGSNEPKMLTEQKVEPSTDNTDWKTVLKFLLSNVPFLLFLIGHTLVASSLRVLASIQTDILRDRGFTTGDTTTALMIFNFSGIPGRLVVGLVKKIPHGSSFIFVVITAFFATPAIIGLRFINNLWQAALLSSMCGIALGAAHASNGVSLLSLVGTDYSTPAVGLSFGVTGILVTVTGPLMGKHANNDYHGYNAVNVM